MPHAIQTARPPRKVPSARPPVGLRGFWQPRYANPRTSRSRNAATTSRFELDIVSVEREMDRSCRSYRHPPAASRLAGIERYGRIVSLRRCWQPRRRDACFPRFDRTTSVLVHKRRSRLIRPQMRAANNGQWTVNEPNRECLNVVWMLLRTSLNPTRGEVQEQLSGS